MTNVSISNMTMPTYVAIMLRVTVAMQKKMQEQMNRLGIAMAQLANQ